MGKASILMDLSFNLGRGERVSKYIICLLVIGGMKYTGHWEEQVRRWGQMRSSFPDTVSVKCLCDNQVEKE